MKENSEKGINNSDIFIRYLVVLMMIAAFAACTSTPKQDGRGIVDDFVIMAKIKTQLTSDDFLKSFEIGVESRKGIFKLSGFVDSREAVNKAGQIAHGVKGVKSFKNDLIIK